MMAVAVNRQIIFLDCTAGTNLARVGLSETIHQTVRLSIIGIVLEASVIVLHWVRRIIAVQTGAIVDSIKRQYRTTSSLEWRVLDGIYTCHPT